jgi:DNA-binding transcriptional ArsR family regulator
MDYFYAIAEPHRRKIIELLADEGQLSASQIYAKFDVTAQAVSQHLKVLLDTKFVKMERHAQQHIYQLNPDSISEIAMWVSKMEALWDGRLDKLDAILKSEIAKDAKKR